MGFVAVHSRITGPYHLERSLACEDACGVRTDMADGRIVVAVADGHGDRTCVRSAKGAQIAVDVVLDALASLASESCQALLDRDAAELVTRDLVCSIATDWEDAVLAHLAKSPLAPAELEGLDCELMNRWLKARPTHLYGTTVVAALITSELCLCVQQGDGCCVLVWRDGEAQSPMPVDERCVGNQTSSLSDEDAAERMRLCAIDLRTRQLVGCFVASDGVGKSFGDDRDTETFFKRIVVDAQGKGQQELEDMLTPTLANVSEAGSRDDASVAGVVDVLLPSDRVVALSAAVRRRELERELDVAQNKLVSMERKHRRLEELWEAGEEGASEYETYHAAYVEWERRASCLRDELLMLDESINERFDRPLMSSQAQDESVSAPRPSKTALVVIALLAVLGAGVGIFLLLNGGLFLPFAVR